jgi:ankyrin repeat protein
MLVKRLETTQQVKEFIMLKNKNLINKYARKACKSGNLQVLRELYKHRSFCLLSHYNESDECKDPWIYNDSINCVIAAKHGHLDIVEWLITVYTVQFEYIFSEIVQINNLMIIKLVTKNNIVPLATLYYGLEVARSKKLSNIECYLVHYICKVLVDNPFAINIACKENDETVVEMLINCDCKLNSVNYYKVTSLMIACRKGNENIVKLLINAGCDLNLADFQGNTAVMIACDNKNLKIVKLLIDAGCLV